MCEIDEELKAQLKKFRFRKDKNISAIVCKSHCLAKVFKFVVLAIYTDVC